MWEAVLAGAFLNLDPISEERTKRYFMLHKTTLPSDVEHISKTYLPEYELPAMFYIEQRLGYLPDPKHAKRHEFYVRWALCRFHLDEILRYEHCVNEMDIHVRHIRNADMKEALCLKDNAVSYSDLLKYETHLIEHKDIVRSKIQCVLGYIPDLKHTLKLELYMREFTNELNPDKRFEVNQLDYRAITGIQYRETHIKHGVDTANNLPLLGPGVA